MFSGILRWVVLLHGLVLSLPAHADQGGLPAPVASPGTPDAEVSGQSGGATPAIGALTVFADSDETMGQTPLAVRLEVEVLEGTGVPPYQYRWDFGDGTRFSDEQNPAHIYRVPGNFRASVIVIDARKEVDQDYVDVTVHEPRGAGDISARELRAWVLSRGIPEDDPEGRLGRDESAVVAGETAAGEEVQ